MGTPFTDIYKIFMSQITNYSLLNILEEDDGEKVLSENLKPWLHKAIVDFGTCRQDLTDISEEDDSFNVTLTIVKKQILAHYMLMAQLNTLLIDDSLLRQKLNSRDYRQYSESGLIQAINNTKQQLNDEAQLMLSRYSWNFGRVKERFKK